MYHCCYEKEALKKRFSRIYVIIQGLVAYYGWGFNTITKSCVCVDSSQTVHVIVMYYIGTFFCYQFTMLRLFLHVR